MLKRKKNSGRVVSEPERGMNSSADGVNGIGCSCVADFNDCCVNDGDIMLFISQEEWNALENRCKVAEDLNKVYVRMYLEMQDKYDRLAQSC